MHHHFFSWLGFGFGIIFFLWLDWAVFQRKGKEISIKKALYWSACWVLLALSFNTYLYLAFGKEEALTFFAGYLVEKSLSLDNVFLFFVIFSFFKVPIKYQPRVLFQGIIFAFILRLLLIVTGLTVLEAFEWTKYLFGAFIAFTGVRLMRQKADAIDFEKSWILKVCRKIFPITNEYEGGSFFVRKHKKLWATPLFLVLLLIEGTDLLFALDSVPAVMAITRDPFIIYTSNIFAILGLRALYFVVAHSIGLFCYLKYGLGGILILMGIKMVYPLPLGVALGGMVAILTFSILASLKRKASD